MHLRTMVALSSIPLPRHGRAAPASRRGYTLFEVTITMMILLVAVGMYTKIVVSTDNLRRQTHERGVASRAARIAMEALYGEEFEEVFSLFNADPNDDPGSKGSAPGNLFRVRGLTPLPDAVNEAVGEIVFPAALEAAAKAKPLKEKEKAEQGLDFGGIFFLGGQSPFPWELREDVEDFALGMPRDLNGDYIVDAEDHAEDYARIPVCIRVRWQGPSGPQEYRAHVILAPYPKRDAKEEADLDKAREEAAKEQRKQAEKQAKEEEKAREKAEKEAKKKAKKGKK